MVLDFRNTNTLWASILVETLYRLGLSGAVCCPGSRCTPLTLAFAQHPDIDAIPILDERSAAFFALGMAKRLGLPVALVCTSGTATANFYPAIVEAKESRVPLLVLTADRPPELRHCHAGQTIDQLKLYGNYPNWQAELPLPCLDLTVLSYLRQTMIYAWERSLFPHRGVVHLNLPFREPLAPIPEAETTSFSAQFNPQEFFRAVVPVSPSPQGVKVPPTLLQQWQSYQRGVIIVGVTHSSQPETYCRAIAYLSKILQYPVLAEALSPLRNYAQINPYLICTYDFILRRPSYAAQLTPDIVIQLGELPTSKVIRSWLETTQPQRWIIDLSAENLDPLQGKTIHLRTSIEQLIGEFNSSSDIQIRVSSYLQYWLDVEIKVRKNIDEKMQSVDSLLEAKITWMISHILPKETPIFIANSMPVRDAEFFWRPNHLKIFPYFNRGANGIDGTLSTALGVAYQNKSSVLLTGDLALLHDTNGFLVRQNFQGHLTIILINNNGGGIFEMLPIAEFSDFFEDFFATPQNINFAQLCSTYQVEHYLITDWKQLTEMLRQLPLTGIRVLEVTTNRKIDATWLKNNVDEFSFPIF